MRCSYPNCIKDAISVPVIAIPTLRTVGMIQPVLSPHINNREIMGKMELDINMTIRIYEAEVADYKAHCNDMSSTDEPTYLIGTEVCGTHAFNYKFLDWYGVKNFNNLIESARAHNLLLDIHGVKVQFKPIGWEPGGSYLEVER